MFRRNISISLPMLLSGLPMLAVNWLRIAGVPTVPFQSKPLFRQGETAVGQILVFDARDATARLDARIARESGAEIINVADLLPRDIIQPAAPGIKRQESEGYSLQSLRSVFFDELKQRVESAGGFWLRLADYPFPYQSVVCCAADAEDELQRLATEYAVEVYQATAKQSPTTDETAVEWMTRLHAAGQPMFLGCYDTVPIDAESEIAAVMGGDEIPLMWQTTGDEFRRWCGVRAGLTLSATKTNSVYRVRHNGDCDRFRPTIELWLGSHVASLPLADSEMTLREDGILFVQEQRRHAAGLAAGWSESADTSRIWNNPAHQPV